MPACGASKAHRREPFCPECMDDLPEELLILLADHTTFIDAFGPAVRHIERIRFCGGPGD